jgi:hypothetical protein
MSPNSLRVLAGAAAAVIVLLTGIAVGLLGAAPECPAPAAPVQQTIPSPATTSAAPTGNPGGTVNEGNGGNNNGGNNNGGGSLGGTVGARDRSTEGAQDQRPQETVGATNGATDQGAPFQAATTPACEGENFSIPAALAGVAGAGLATVTLLGFLLAAQARKPVVPVSGPPAAGGPARGADPRLDADRAALVRACIYVRDRVTSRALADRLAAALRDAGVNVVEPVGDRFDPARHEAGGATPATDPAQTGTIAAVEVPGYVDRTGRVLRAPVVTVYQAGPGGPAAHSPAANAVNQPSGAYPTVNPPSGAYPTVSPTVSQRTTPGGGPGAGPQPRRRTEEDR